MADIPLFEAPEEDTWDGSPVFHLCDSPDQFSRSIALFLSIHIVRATLGAAYVTMLN